MAFDEVRFPTNISYGATTRPRRVVDVVVLRSGHEERNSIWSDSRRSFDISLGIRNINDVHAVQEFWEGRRGRLRGFRMKDWSDYKSCPPLSVPSATDHPMIMLTSTTYQLAKVYSPASNPWTREIIKPVAGSVVVADDTGVLAQGSDWTIDTTTGVVTFASAPTGTPTAGFEFDVPVRFESESLEINVELFRIGSLPAITLVEVRS